MSTNISYKLESSQIRAIKKSIDLGARIQEDFPEVAELYRSGETPSRIVEKLKLERYYGANKLLVEDGIYSSLKGNIGGKFQVRAYDGLIPLEEFRMIARRNWQENGKKLGILTRDEKRGIHAMTPEQRKSHGYRAGMNAVRARNQSPWTEEEKTTAYELYKNPQYKYKPEKKNSRVNLTKIRDALTAKGFPQRTVRALEFMLGKIRSSNE